VTSWLETDYSKWVYEFLDLPRIFENVYDLNYGMQFEVRFRC
jgi:hypothetical protein